MRKILYVAALMLALGCPALAGEIPNPPAPEPTPSSAVQQPADDAMLNGDISTPGVSDILTEAALDLLAVLPTLL
jgi:hypothetical protein